MGFEPGRVVFSKRGRDKGAAMLVLRAEGDYLWLIDGGRRKLEKPKRKKVIHVQPTNAVIAEIHEKIINGKNYNDAEVRKALKRFADGEVEHV
jgi:ribosomal protein L14E/L6E/L27E